MFKNNNHLEILESKIIFVTFESIANKYILEWLVKENYNVNHDSQLFIKFMEKKFKVVYDEINKKWLIKSEQLMKMNLTEIQEFNKFVSAYNNFIIINKEKFIPKLTRKCEKYYAKQIQINEAQTQEINILKLKIKELENN
ncbi:hypothetical protein [Spiroplasma culicicola]|uniref:Uncharacterized protein n=1 Tax=Spiroplasma culicicola AES-1 TaxID=1276246 RepID=W6A5T9_9MOLU|nr:hypothetical protein [Spiroplasma culicicola]AHI52503.1 hypothetical protein SCULI_v1c01620 [Spiroplasma culicicola AES-1]